MSSGYHVAFPDVTLPKTPPRRNSRSQNQPPSPSADSTNSVPPFLVPRAPSLSPSPRRALYTIHETSSSSSSYANVSQWQPQEWADRDKLVPQPPESPSARRARKISQKFMEEDRQRKREREYELDLEAVRARKIPRTRELVGNRMALIDEEDEEEVDTSSVVEVDGAEEEVENGRECPDAEEIVRPVTPGPEKRNMKKWFKRL